MFETQLNYFDITIVSVVVISMLVSLFRGFVSELLSLAAWIGASIITVFALPFVSARLQEKFGVSQLIASGLGSLGTFIAAIIVLGLFNKLLTKMLKEGSEVGSIDKLLGLVFGFVRGAFLVSLGFMMFQMLFDKEHYPEWVAQARTRPAVEWGAGVISALAPDYMSQLTGKTAEEKAAARDQLKDDKTKVENKAKDATEGATDKTGNMLDLLKDKAHDAGQSIREMKLDPITGQKVD